MSENSTNTGDRKIGDGDAAADDSGYSRGHSGQPRDAGQADAAEPARAGAHDEAQEDLSDAVGAGVDDLDDEESDEFLAVDDLDYQDDLDEMDDTDEADGEAEVEELDMEVFDITADEAEDDYIPVTMHTSRGEIACRYYDVTDTAPDAQSAVIWVGGVGGGFDSPAQDLYPRLCKAFQARGVASLRVQYRSPTELEECVLDVLAGLGMLESEGFEALALVGHSLGGAVVIQAGTGSEAVRAVVTLATQSYGAADVVAELPEDCALLLVHGTADTVLPPQSSEYVYSLAHAPRKLVLYEDAGHGLDEVADEVSQTVSQFVLARLRPDVGLDHRQ